MEKLTVTFKKDAAKVGDVSADAIVIDHPDFENGKETFATIFGQEGVSIQSVIQEASISDGRFMRPI